MMATVKPYDTAKGTRYRVRYRTPEGRQTDKRGFATKAAAETFANVVEVDKLEGRYVAPAAGLLTVGHLAQDWYDSKIDVKPSSLERYRQTLEQQVLPRWQNVNVAKVTAPALQAWINELSRDRAPSTVKKAHHAMSMILDVAVRDRRIAANPASGINLPRARHDEPTFLTREQLFTLAEKAGPGELVVLTLGFTGLRWGEMAALKVRRWDGGRRRLTVAESVTEINGLLNWGTPKTHATRTVPVPTWLAARITESTTGKGPDDLLFSTPSGGVLRNKNARRDWFDQAVVDARLPRVTPHDLRHTAASIAISVGANVKAVQRMLGHASAAMTLDLYAGLFEDDLNDVADRIEGPPMADVVTLRVVNSD
ncbi:tyrosine-type recombinase/integrase [Rhodococcus sp. Leaf233]|uniref:tyrosine-type recombinase/integrase n=1 Tax=Rhodococcus sp. Leaf233 TaxID=1736302 RepID=UPI0009E7B55D|nr:site-specific integrase [Rhodococcus sp. Leaf233]